MSYREIPPDKILKFSHTAGFKGWERFFSDESISHPAKANLKLVNWILNNYTLRGETVLDPMAGTGSTAILAALNGRNGVAVELEPKFCAMIKENMELTQQQKTLTPKGDVSCIEGDARRLSELLAESDVIITSPPYASPGGAILDRAFMEKLALDPNSNRYGRKTFPGYGKYSESPEQIGNKQYGDIDSIITSPPYGNRLSDVAVDDGDPARMGYRQTVDVVLTSPPYSEGLGHSVKRPSKVAIEKKQTSMGQKSETGYSLQKENIGNLPHGDIDAIVTSPPYEDSRAFQDIDFMKSIVHEQNIKAKKGETKSHYRTDEAELRYLNKIDGVEYEDNNNIGNLKSDSYLEAMLQVYREAWKVLKPSGRMVLIVKNFIRDKQVVRLDLDTIKLCEAAGFTLDDRWYFELPQKSFWRILYSKKYPKVPEIDYEDILIFKKHRF